MSLYTDTIRQWATDTRRAGPLPDADGVGEVGLESSEAGRRLAARFMLKLELGRVADVRYEVFGCGFSMAACAVAADMAVGYNLADMAQIDSQRLDEALQGLPPERSYCADLAVEALQAAVRSAKGDQRPVAANLKGEEEHGPRVSASDPVYRMLMATPQPKMATPEDRHLFACLLTVALQEMSEPAAALGVADCTIEAILAIYFPGVTASMLCEHAANESADSLECNDDVLAIIKSHIPSDSVNAVPVWLSRILATRAVLPGHLWVAMGLTERPQLTAAIRRHFPSLAEANSQNMRWKRYLYKQVCDLDGGNMCKAPNCGECSDYGLCFTSEG